MLFAFKTLQISWETSNFIKIFSHGNTGAGFLGPKYQPFSLNPEGRLPTFSTSSLKPEIESRRNSLRNFVEDIYARRHKAETVRMHRQAYEAARRLQNVQSVFKIDDEWEKYRDLYGDSAFGRRCLMARRLIEEGVPFVEVGQSSYDSHADNFVWHRALVPPMRMSGSSADRACGILCWVAARPALAAPRTGSLSWASW